MRASPSPRFAAMLIAACAALPDDAPVVENLDEETGLTIARLGRPLELYNETSSKDVADRFAFLGPFETNQMGNRELFLWVALPMENPGGSPAPTVLVDGAALELGEAGSNAEFAGLRKSPYRIPTPWIANYYFRIDRDIVARLGAATTCASKRSTRRSAGRRACNTAATRRRPAPAGLRRPVKMGTFPAFGASSKSGMSPFTNYRRGPRPAA